MVSMIFFMFTPNLGEMIQFDEHIFQMGWFNHQLVFAYGPKTGAAFLRFFAFKVRVQSATQWTASVQTVAHVRTLM